MTIAVFFAAALVSQAVAPPAQSPEWGPVRRDTYSLQIPDQIAPAIIPYLACLMAARGQRIPTEKGGPVLEGITRGSDCGAYRKAASKRAYLLISENSRAGRRERKAYVESSLEDVERWVGSLPVVPEEAK